MSVEALPRPAEPGTGDADFDHLYCPCTPDLAFCGEDVSACPVLDGEFSSDRVCPLCLVLADANNDACARCGQ